MWPFSKKKEDQVEYATKPEDISEPIISFVNLVRDNHKRFAIKLKDKKSYYGYTTTIWELKDRKTGEVFTFGAITKIGGHYYFATKYEVSLPWVTSDECAYLYKEIAIVKNAQKEKVLAYKNNKARNRYMNIYGPKENS